MKRLFLIIALFLCTGSAGAVTFFQGPTGGGLPATNVTHSATEAATLATMDARIHYVSGAYTVSLPSCSTPYGPTPFIASTAAVYSLDPTTGTDVVVLNGSSLTAGNKATSDGTTYNQMKVQCDGAGKIFINSLTGLAIDGGA